MPSRVVDWNTITNFVTEAFMKYGVPEEDARICTDVLLESDRRGNLIYLCHLFRKVREPNDFRAVRRQILRTGGISNA